MSNTLTLTDVKPGSEFVYDFTIENTQHTEATSAVEIKDLYDPHHLADQVFVRLVNRDQKEHTYIEKISLADLQLHGYSTLETVAPNSSHNYSMIVNVNNQLKDDLQETSLTFNLRIGTEQEQQTTTIHLETATSSTASATPTSQLKAKIFASLIPSPSPAILGVTETIPSITPLATPLVYSTQHVEQSIYSPVFLQAVTMSICILLILLAVVIHLLSKKL